MFSAPMCDEPRPENDDSRGDYCLLIAGHTGWGAEDPRHDWR